MSTKLWGNKQFLLWSCEIPSCKNKFIPYPFEIFSETYKFKTLAQVFGLQYQTPLTDAIEITEKSVVRDQWLYWFGISSVNVYSLFVVHYFVLSSFWFSLNYLANLWVDPEVIKLIKGKKKSTCKSKSVMLNSASFCKPSVALGSICRLRKSNSLIGGGAVHNA